MSTPKPQPGLTRADIEDGFDVSPNGIIHTKGEYEGHPVYAPYFYDLALAQRSFPKGEGREEVYLMITPVDRTEFPELQGHRYVHVVVDSTREPFAFRSATATDRPGGVDARRQEPPPRHD